MMLGNHNGPVIRRTTSITEFTIDLSYMEAPPTEVSDLVKVTRNSPKIIETPPFLRTCGLCRRRLASGRDIYMYRGDTAFCSLECRQQQMKQDELKEKYIMGSSNRGSSSSTHVVGSETSSSSSCKGGTIAAA